MSDSRYAPTVRSKGLSIASIDRVAFRDCGTENDVGRVPFDAIILMSLLSGLCKELARVRLLKRAGDTIDERGWFDVELRT